MSNIKQTITDSEYQIMKILWDSKEKMTVADVSAKLDGNDWTASTVSTFLQRLLKNGKLSVQNLQGLNQKYGCGTLRKQKAFG